MKKIFICHALAGDVKNNILKAEGYAKEIAIRGDMPIIPHQVARYLDDDNQTERAIGMNLSIELLKLCDEIHVIGKVTKGMKNEIETAKDNLIQIIYLM
jgi:hypothetical protein